MTDFGSRKQSEASKTQLDGGFSWFVVFGAFITQFVVMGIHNGYGLLYIELLREFDESKATIGKSRSISKLRLLNARIILEICYAYTCNIASVI